MRAATDTGGTFTDIVYCEFDEDTGAVGEVRIAKAHTTPPNFEQGVLNVLSAANIDAGELSYFAHGSTVVINALTERKGSKTGLITTSGFRDVLEIARGNRPDLFNLAFHKPPPFVPRYLRAEIEERITHKGDVQTSLVMEDLPAIIDHFKAEGVEAIAICLLHAYLNPVHEQQLVEAISEVWPQVSVLASHQVSREWREYERTSSTVLSAYVHPVAEKYIDALESKLNNLGLQQSPYMMQSNGGITTTTAAKRNPVTMVESGPASGIHAAACLGKIIDEPNLIVLDIGGTTAKCTLIENHQVRVSTHYAIEKDRGSPGYPIQTPVSEIVEIGNGGGSIAWVDSGNKLRVGPQSAGAMPGPAAYGNGGTQATTTDANLVLGRIDPDSFVGGEIEPDWAAVSAAFEPIQDALEVSKEDAAEGVLRIANANMVNALRLVSVNKGYDPREFTLIAFGGGGAMHAIELARELQIPKVVVPVNSSVFSAWGMLMTDLRRDYIRTQPGPMSVENLKHLQQTFDQLMAEAERDYIDDGQDIGEGLGYTAFLDLRYVGQEHTVKVQVAPPFDGDGVLASIENAFHQAHEREFTYSLDLPLEVVNLHLVAELSVEKPELKPRQVLGHELSEARLPSREVCFDGQFVKAQIFNGLLIEQGMSLTGPAIVQEPSVTLVVPPGYEVTVDAYGNYLATAIDQVRELDQ